MAHNPPVFPPGTLPPTFVPTPKHWDFFDQLQSESIDGAAGHASPLAPTSPIMVGGAGMDMRGATCFASGATSTSKGSHGLVLAGSVYPTFPVSRTRRVVVPLYSTSEFDQYAITGFEPVFEPYYGMRSLKASQWFWLFALPQLRLHNGATLKRAYLRWRSGAMPAALSQNGMPWFRIFRAKKDGPAAADFSPTNIAELWKVPDWQANTAYAVDDCVQKVGDTTKVFRCVTAGTSGAVQPAWSTTAGANQADNTVTWRVEYGWSNAFLQSQYPAVPLNADVATYHNDGLPQSILHRVNMNATIDTDTYNYAVELADPGIYGNIYHSIVLEIEGLTALKEP